MDTTEKQKEELSADEFLKKRAAYYNEILPALRVLHEHEKLQCELHEFRMRAKFAILKLAEIDSTQKPQTPETK
jgi:hypothetical protein